MYLKVYANGSGAGRGSHISEFACLMCGIHDISPWPLILMEQ